MNGFLRRVSCNRAIVGRAVVFAVLGGLALAAAGCEQSGKSGKGRAAKPGAAAAAGEAGVVKSDFGKTKEGEAVEMYTLTNKNGVVAKLITYGASLTELHVPDRSGKAANVVLGFDNLDQYLAGHPYFGA